MLGAVVAVAVTDGGGIAGGDGAAIAPGEAADVDRPGNRPAGPAGRNGAPVVAHQDSGLIAAAHRGVLDAHIADGGAAAGVAEQAILLGSAADVQVGDGVPVAFENGIKSFRSAEAAAVDRRPAGAAVPVGIAVVGPAVAVGVKVQVGHQLVAGAVAGGAAHSGPAAGVAVGKSAVVHIVAGDGGVAVAVIVVADGIQLRQGGNFNQAVVIGIVVGPVAGRFAGARRDSAGRRQ